jgi:putative protein-disulfide isomerase
MVQKKRMMTTKEPFSKDKTTNKVTDQVALVCYTDPLCCWSWGMQPQLQRLLEEFPGRITVEYCMGGLIPSWEEFSDPLNSIQNPSQMGPMWMQAGHLTGRPIDDMVWISDPPSSSYPACIAVKTAQMQSPEAGKQLLFRLSEAVMENRKNISKTEVISQVAEALAKDHPEVIDFERFKKEYNGDLSREAFRQDLQKVKLNKIGRFPTFTISSHKGHGVMITGYRPYEALLEAIRQVAPL